jgi:hypothetical protein
MANDIIIPKDIDTPTTVYKDIVSCITPDDILSFKFNGVKFDVMLSNGVNDVQSDINTMLVLKGYKPYDIITDVMGNDLFLSVREKQYTINGIIFADMDVIY